MGGRLVGRERRDGREIGREGLLDGERWEMGDGDWIPSCFTDLVLLSGQPRIV